MGHIVRFEAGGIVAGHLDMSDAMGSGAVVFVKNHRAHGSQAPLVVRSDGSDENEEDILVGRTNADLRAAADEKGTDIQRAAGAVGRHEILVGLNHSPNGVQEKILGDLGHANAAGGHGHAAGIFRGPKETHLAVATHESLEPLESRLPVVQSRGRDVQPHERLFDQSAFVPGTVSPYVADVAMRLNVLEAEILPVNGHRNRPRAPRTRYSSLCKSRGGSTPPTFDISPHIIELQQAGRKSGTSPQPLVAFPGRKHRVHVDGGADGYG